MCSGHIESKPVTGSAKGAIGWFALNEAHASYDHAFHASMDDALVLNFLDTRRGPSARVTVELNDQSARDLVTMIKAALAHSAHASATG
jgi:hypothetical protein